MKNNNWDGAVAGMTAAAASADAKAPGWTERALSFLTEYAKDHPEGFMACDVVEASQGNPDLEPPDGRAWGAIVVIAKRKGVIAQFGFSYTRKGKGHPAPKSVWKAVA
jgi:hypothetical protein